MGATSIPTDSLVRRYGAAGLALASFFVPMASAMADCPLEPAEGGRVAAVIDGATLRLDDGLVIRLAGIAAPEPPLSAAVSPWPLAEAARAALAKLALGQDIALELPLAGRDRYGRAIAVVTAEGADGSLNEALIAEGLARVMPGDEPSGCLSSLFATEREARENRLGLWSDPYYAIRAARDPALADRADVYDLVEGRVLSVGVRGRVAYLDFGRDWRTDFTAVVAGPAGEALAALGQAPASLRGRHVRLRGWIEDHDGPSLRVTNPAQLELLDDGD
ncbi:thermonuclease family protein [Mesorhizobium sp. BR1-1-16]|uniref:thermonuclease family protein n=1 Tax=Mesorhizobium sp. BR1-1-16 TaxID=2876653 RepID=UPI001CCE9B04|nr:thermonuclease family protein [Mesorhizobium sp. BR1-1-16]MBZ9937396.1 thermonuclease family protein [Mesorhizobium sp. BR1-1-16]